METEVVAQRTVRGFSGAGEPTDLTILIGQPIGASDATFACEFDVEGLLRSRTRTAIGRDSWGALSKAMRAAVEDIIYYNSAFGPVQMDDEGIGMRLDPTYERMCRHHFASEPAEARELALPLAEAGSMHAQSILGHCYFLTDLAKAEYWLRKAADGQSPQACVTLASILNEANPGETAYYRARANEYGWPSELNWAL